MAEHQHDPAGLLVQVDRWLRWTVCAVFPLCVLLTLLLTQVVAVAMGPHWAAAGQAALPLVGLMVLSTLMFPSGVALIAVGGARFALYGHVASLLTGCAGAVLLRPADPWQAVMLWTVCQLVVCPYAMAVNARALGVGMLRPLGGGLRVWKAA
jgi:O-antigen/teichoic acid export membrane protein